jgi:cystathionine beta-synthase
MTNLHQISVVSSAPREDTGVLEAIGNTPILKVRGLDTGTCELFLKLETKNPGGSIKDRVGKAMIDAAERSGHLRPGMTIVEGTSGNTGIALALVGGLKGYKVKLVMPDRVSKHKIYYCQALGAEVVLTRSDVERGHPQHFTNLAESFGRESGNYHMNQFANPANAEAHYRTTGPELIRDLGLIDAVVCGVGSGGTLTGLSAYFAERSPDTEFVLADPVGSVIDQLRCRESEAKFSRYLVEGVGSDFMPPLADLSRVVVAYRVPDSESLAVCREVASTNGLLVGTSSGVLIAAALRYCRAQTLPKRVVTFACDGGDRYFQKIYGLAA